jgi:hypothetical protein
VVIGSIPTGWTASNCDGRTITVSGATTFGPVQGTNTAVTGGPMAAGADGRVYFNFSAGTYSYTALSLF